MATEKKNYWLIFFSALFIGYTFLASELIPDETVFAYQWITSLETGRLEENAQAADTRLPSEPVPFEIGNRFGYVDWSGSFFINKEKKANVYLSPNLFSEYDGRPDTITVADYTGKTVLELEQPNGYPFFLDNTVFLLNSEQCSISRLDEEGNVLWTRDFAAPITCADAAAGILVVGLLDGTAEIIGVDGERLYFSEPSGSRIAAVYGCAISPTGTAIALVRGLDVQRFIYIEQFGSAWRVTHHEFLEDGMRRQVYVMFTHEGRRVIFEREDGIGIYDAEKRQSSRVQLNGKVVAMEREGGNELLLLVTQDTDLKNRFIAIQYPETILIEAPFESKNVSLARNGNFILTGSDGKLAAFRIERK